MTVTKQEPFTTKGANDWQTEHPWEPSPISFPHPLPLVKPTDLFNPMLTVADVMKRDAPTCSVEAPLAEAARILRDSASSAVYVVSDGRPIGLLTDRRLALALADHDGDLKSLHVRDLINPRVPTARADAQLGALLDNFADEGVVVVDGRGQMQGVVRWLELLGHVSERALGKLVVNLFSPRRER